MGVFMLYLLEALRPWIVDLALVISVREDGTYEDCMQNAVCFLGGRKDNWGVLAQRDATRLTLDEQPNWRFQSQKR